MLSLGLRFSRAYSLRDMDGFTRYFEYTGTYQVINKTRLLLIFKDLENLNIFYDTIMYYIQTRELIEDPVTHEMITKITHLIKNEEK